MACSGATLHQSQGKGVLANGRRSRRQRPSTPRASCPPLVFRQLLTQALLRNVYLLDEAKQADARLLARYVRR